MNLLFTLNENYLPPFYTLLRSIFYSNSREEVFDIYLMHKDISENQLLRLEAFINNEGHSLHVIDCTNLFEEDTVVNRYYSIEMYYRLLAPFVLPDKLDRILYLDPDIINLNSFAKFYNQDFKDNLFIATTHEYATKWIQPLNNLRLGTLKSEDYFNTGILLMNLPEIRTKVTPDDIFKAIQTNKNRLVLPDQDIFNHLYWNRIGEADWRIYNLDPRFYSKLKLFFPAIYNQEWVEKNVVFIHYCGKHKPWLENEKYRYDLGFYYHEFETDHTYLSAYHPELEEQNDA